MADLYDYNAAYAPPPPAGYPTYNTKGNYYNQQPMYQQGAQSSYGYGSYQQQPGKVQQQQQQAFDMEAQQAANAAAAFADLKIR